MELPIASKGTPSPRICEPRGRARKHCALKALLDFPRRRTKEPPAARSQQEDSKPQNRAASCQQPAWGLRAPEFAKPGCGARKHHALKALLDFPLRGTKEQPAASKGTPSPRIHEARGQEPVNTTRLKHFWISRATGQESGQQPARGLRAPEFVKPGGRARKHRALKAILDFPRCVTTEPPAASKGIPNLRICEARGRGQEILHAYCAFGYPMPRDNRATSHQLPARGVRAPEFATPGTGLGNTVRLKCCWISRIARQQSHQQPVRGLRAPEFAKPGGGARKHHTLKTLLDFPQDNRGARSQQGDSEPQNSRTRGGARKNHVLEALLDFPHRSTTEPPATSCQQPARVLRTQEFANPGGGARKHHALKRLLDFPRRKTTESPAASKGTLSPRICESLRGEPGNTTRLKRFWISRSAAATGGGRAGPPAYELLIGETRDEQHERSMSLKSKVLLWEL
ncbi:hypothetical protein NDU88_007433 [Pleurodeles waltl]|uniref:Uncharacterized protein n=1 Tax=Pleurodeles waltl TaxID=8319 RepID=A0AAV7RT76_PLEWA|nr:hypothetical protein NDU88_007433 [Pleurodeles waltl]